MKQFVWLSFLFFPAAVSYSQADSREKQFNLSDHHIAIQGYDPVAYYVENKAVEGNSSLKLNYQGVTYLFKSKENLDLFKANPSKYEPEYGGWCAYAMGAKGEKVEVDPETFKIIDGKLYLFYNKFFNNTLESWNKDETRLKTNADQSWAKFIR